ncbi:hypothetical protein Tco_0721371 [Tanacetum coccineum]
MIVFSSEEKMNLQCYRNRQLDYSSTILMPVDEKILVSYVINGLGDRFDQVAGIIRHRDPTPTFAQTQSMLLLEESRLARSSLIVICLRALYQVRSFCANSNNRTTPTKIFSTASHNYQVRALQLWYALQISSCAFGMSTRLIFLVGLNTNVSDPQWRSLGSFNWLLETMHGVKIVVDLIPPIAWDMHQNEDSSCLLWQAQLMGLHMLLAPNGFLKRLQSKLYWGSHVVVWDRMGASKTLAQAFML